GLPSLAEAGWARARSTVASAQRNATNASAQATSIAGCGARRAASTGSSARDSGANNDTAITSVSCAGPWSAGDLRRCPRAFDHQAFSLLVVTQVRNVTHFARDSA